MKKLALVLGVALVCSLVDTRRDLPVCYATPQATIAEYWHRMIERRPHEALECFLGVVPREVSGLLQLPEVVELRCRDFRIAPRGRGVVDVEYRVEFRVALTDSLARFPTGDRLQLTASGWKIERPLLVAAQRP